MKTSARWLAVWFGCGYAPKGPGTAGSAAALLIAILLHLAWPLPPFFFGILAALLLIPGIWAAGVVARDTGGKDPQVVVVDEVIGQWTALAGAATLNWKSWLAAFLLFRLFDIWKPFPIRKLESLPGGTGIVMDDVMAGIYAALVLFTAGWFNLY
ncbi:MAG TPA: phosphatidylglycerophosphatase A [Bryobacteraceae bacterium]|nr:phosphatidylglycerophosphatase A [Bryobacteraceae bacterium]